MALKWDLGKIEGWQDVCLFYPKEKERQAKNGHLRPKTEALIWITWFVGINEITKKNIDEFWWRHQFLLLTGNGYFSTHPDTKEKYGIPCTPWELKREDVEAHIGLKTNVENLTRHKFCQQQLRLLKTRVRDKSNYPQPIVGEEQEAAFDKAFQDVNKSWEDAQ